MRFAQRRVAIWQVGDLWKCSPWEVVKRPASEVFIALDYLSAKGQVEQMQQLRADMQNKASKTKHIDI